MIRALDDVPLALERLAAAGRTAGRQWTLAQIAEHVARTIDWTMGLRELEEPPRRTVPRWLRGPLRGLVLLTGFIPPNLPTPAGLAPPASTPLDEALRHLRESIGRLGAADGPLPENPFFGSLTREQWLRFHLLHARHHLAYVR